MYLGTETFLLNTGALPFSDEQFEQFCLDNKELRIERDENRNIIIMAPTYALSGSFNSLLIFLVTGWNVDANFPGVVFDSSTGFTLPDGSMRSPDVSWISKSRWGNLSDADKRSFAPICPEFVIELKSETDHLPHLQDKMEHAWLKNGVQLGLLVNPETEQVHVYRPATPTRILKGFDSKVSCDPELSGCELDLSLLKGPLS